MPKTILCAVLVCFGWITSSALPQTLSCPDGITIVDENYQPNPSGNYWLIPNWIDVDSNELVTLTPDLHNFRTSAGAGSVIRMSDPTALAIQDPLTCQSWFYFTGSSAPYQTGNFPIYRTSDFRNFELHMTAFSEVSTNGSMQSRSGGRLTIGSDLYLRMWAPQLRLIERPGEPSIVRLIFTAVENYIPPAGERQDHHSVYYAEILLTDFLAWHDPIVQSTTSLQYFFDHPGRHVGARRFGYLNPDETSVLFDGGYSRMNGGETKWLGCTVNESMMGTQCGELSGYVWGRTHNCLAAPASRTDLAPGMTVMWLDPYFFTDPALANHAAWKHSVVYTWNRHDPSLGHEQWGQSIAAQSLRTDVRHVRETVNCIPLAYARNRSNALIAPSYSSGYSVVETIDNGSGDLVFDGFNALFGTSFVGGTLVETAFTAVAEGPAVFRRVDASDATSPIQDLYLLVTRNFWRSPSYQITYRKLASASGTLATGKLTEYDDVNVEEKLLLRSSRHSLEGGRNFGHPDVFFIYDNYKGRDVPIMIFHVLMDNAVQPDGTFIDKRVIWMKELSFDENGDIRQLVDGGSDLSTNVRYLRIPALCDCCAADYDSSSSIDLSDLLDFLAEWMAYLGQSVSHGTSGDFNGDGVIDLADLLEFNARWMACLGQ